jgi:ABC-2 type transport system permease protein
MLEIARYETARRVRGTAVLAVLLAVFGLFTVAFFPSVEASSAALEEYIRNLPPAFRAAFGIESFGTVGGFLATELYQFGWVILLGTYLAYRAGALVAGDVEDRGIDIWLATPVSRRRLVVERYLALVPTVLAVNVVVPLILVPAIALIGEPVPVARLAAVHLLSVPYLLATAAFGLVLSVLASRESVASRGALGLVFGLYLVDSLAATADAGWLGAVSPTRYFDPTAVLVRGEYDLAGAAVLLVAAVALVAAAVTIFRRADVT